MDDYYLNVKRKGHVPAFGSWDCNDDLPFTQCFESARQAGLLRYSYSEDRDLYVAGDLYQNDAVTPPAMIFVPRRRVKSSYPAGVGGKEAKGAEDWVVCDCECGGVDVKEPPSPLPPSPPPPRRQRQRAPPRAVDEDLYKISPELLRATSTRRKKSGWGVFSMCLKPSCVH